MCLPVKPFKIEREWEAFGLKCAVVQAREFQHRCGYVRVSPSHPLHGKNGYEETEQLAVHGGITFSELEDCIEEDGIGYWFGFDCAHCDDSMWEPGKEPNYIKPYPIPHQHYWTQKEVEKETENLAKQLSEIK